MVGDKHGCSFSGPLAVITSPLFAGHNAGRRGKNGGRTGEERGKNEGVSDGSLNSFHGSHSSQSHGKLVLHTPEPTMLHFPQQVRRVFPPSHFLSL